MEKLPTAAGKIALVAIAVAGIAAAEFGLGMRSPASQIAHVFLGAAYLAPVLLAASWFGFRAGIVCAMGASVLHGAHVAIDWPPDLMLGTTQAVQMSVFVVVAGMVGVHVRGDATSSTRSAQGGARRGSVGLGGEA